ncbi:CtsR family transcriptional regulator [Loigolactobacillus zhaoyuanensis]|uniref:Transcriptional regulator CtsR n=1 Tax=Loigolactobacillus zhaoyuanensis TaxID=2486017 RepID=A0ABW8UD45_9LACO|nr:CtsR family transcriptional regulator [Loigolactobacillus zhaoyuanensis]
MQGRNISDIIEAYLKQILAESERIEIKRSEIAELFNCVPSQINYVIKTRFTIQRGYLVQSKRGGGGYIRIEKVKLLDDRDMLDTMIQLIGEQINQRDALALVQKLYDDQVIERKEANLVLAATSHETLAVADRNLEEQLRAHILIGILNHLRYERE